MLEFADSIKFIMMTDTPREESLNIAFSRSAAAYLVTLFTVQDVLDAISLARES